MHLWTVSFEESGYFSRRKDKAINSESFCHFVCSMAGQNVLQVSNPMCVYHESRITHVNWNLTDG